ncbi:muts domain V-domain-containing protein [Zychaea mexicana]|uniref:muts domain V-domain-containing protein n=1 Tax=Zychaea mexicana TaxID=64656 RepID=UPI0022FF004C|nr:muts domain V-domain-containing protein [Zychaea mexicana]KAI9491905.1 muts domain V-domain-containing protein [Zychaea mexicana]
MSSPATKEDIPDIETGEQRSFVKFYRSLPDVEEGTIRFFERDANQKPYYTVHAEDAQYMAHHVYKTTSVIKFWGDSQGQLATTAIGSTVAETFLRDALLNKQIKVEIWTSSKGQWKISKKASPGNLQDVEDLLFLNSSMTTSPVVMAVKLSATTDTKTVGVSFTDTNVKEIGVSEFIDNELYSNFESLVIQLGVKECIVPSNDATRDYELTKLKSVLERCRIVVTEIKKVDYNTKNIEQDLNRLLEGEISITALPEYEMKNAMGSCACLIKYLSLVEDESNFKHYKLKDHDLSQYMRLDASALGALNLMPSPQEGSNKSMSLYGLLNKCKTAQGSRLLVQWLKQPLLNVQEIQRRQDLVEIFYEGTELRQSIQEDHLKNVPDLHRLAKRFQKGIASLQDVVRIYQVVIRLPALITCLEAQAPEDEVKAKLMDDTYTSKIKDYSAKLDKLQEMVETTIDLDAVANHEFIIKPDFDPDLQEIRKEINAARKQIDSEHARVGNKLGFDTEKKLKLENHNVYGQCFRVTRTDASAIRNKPEYIEYATQKIGTYFATSRLKELNDTWSELSKQYQRRQSDLVKEVIGIVATYSPVLELLSGVLAKLDVILSFAHVSIMAPTPYIRPLVQEFGNIVLRDSRHPCLEVQDDVVFIPNDIEMVKDKSEFQIITGPNMGGKSTYIRQTGVIALLAQIGCFVPCAEASIGIFDCILARVGAGDSQLKGVSTFMAEMLETATILKTATANSLIIIDELGRGTSTYDGFGLAWAISEHIATEIRAFCLFATHFHELTALAETIPHVKNLNVAVHMGETGGGLTLLYKVMEGICDQSFGIHVAELAQFPSSVVRLAKRKAAELEDVDPVDSQHTKKQATAESEETSQLLSQIVQELKAAAAAEQDDEALLQTVHGVREKYKQKLLGL